MNKLGSKSWGTIGTVTVESLGITSQTVRSLREHVIGDWRHLDLCCLCDGKRLGEGVADRCGCKVHTSIQFRGRGGGDKNRKLGCHTAWEEPPPECGGCIGDTWTPGLWRLWDAGEKFQEFLLSVFFALLHPV